MEGKREKGRKLGLGLRLGDKIGREKERARRQRTRKKLKKLSFFLRGPQKLLFKAMSERENRKKNYWIFLIGKSYFFFFFS